jgi:hypothetical protein
MLLTPHVLSGMFFADMSPSVFLVPFFSVISFFFLEMIPHWDPEFETSRKNTILRSIDIVLSLVSFLSIVLFRGFDFGVIIGGVSSFLIYFVFHFLSLVKVENPLLSKLNGFRKKLKYHDRSAWGIMVQVAICVLCVTLLLNLVDFPTWERIRKNLLVNLLRF